MKSAETQAANMLRVAHDDQFNLDDAIRLIRARDREVALEETRTIKRKISSFRSRSGEGSTVECWNEFVFWLNERLRKGEVGESKPKDRPWDHAGWDPSVDPSY